MKRAFTLLTLVMGLRTGHGAPIPQTLRIDIGGYTKTTLLLTHTKKARRPKPQIAFFHDGALTHHQVLPKVVDVRVRRELADVLKQMPQQPVPFACERTLTFTRPKGTPQRTCWDTLPHAAKAAWEQWYGAVASLQ